MSCLKEGEVIRCHSDNGYRIVYHTLSEDGNERPAHYVNNTKVHTDEQAIEWAQEWIREHADMLRGAQHKVYVEKIIAVVGAGCPIKGPREEK